MSEHGPSLTRSFLSGLTKYKLAMYANKPSQIDAVAAAKYGCINGGKDWLVCGICNVSWVLAGRNGMANEAANVLVEKQRAPLLEKHEGGYPWKTRLRVSRAASTQNPKFYSSRTKNDRHCTGSHRIQTRRKKHPLASSQLSSLRLGQRLVFRLLLLETLLPCESTKARRERPSSSPFLAGIPRPHPPFTIADSQCPCQRLVQHRSQPLWLFRIDAPLTGTLVFVHGQGGNAYTDGGPVCVTSYR
ncbi:hypothetical protein BKA83DRAFT_3368089 [Pisolithus microcarpus]|nr:hypothetical protein BKA83DRAFT_3368089 [Pisolithus microcarpus]